jgi:putative peptide zinc metalloprotease protein
MQSLPRLRRGLRFTPVIEKGKSWYILEDPFRNTYYRIGVEEYLFVSRLNGSRDFRSLLQSVEKDCDVCLGNEQGQAILQWLQDRQLLQDETGRHLPLALEQEEASARLRRFSRLNFISFKISLFNPDRFLDRVYPALSWLTGRPFFIFWSILAVLALGILVSGWPEFTDQVTGFFSPANLLLIWLIWFLLKLFHELLHALVCRRYGGRIYDFGLLFILFIPLTYIDATSSWTFSSKWQRMHVAAGGIFAELCVTWAAVLVWAMTPDTVSRLIAHNTVMVAGVSSLLFNGNPLMRFDGYYLLSDLISIPNLYSRGIAFVKSVAARIFLGIRNEGMAERGVKGVFIKCYGMAVYIWRILVIISLGYLASRMGGGFGMFAALGGVMIWVGIPLTSFFTRLRFYKKNDPVIHNRFLIRFLVILICAGAGIRYIGWEDRIRIPAVVEYRHQYGVRPAVDGFVAEIKVAAGERVHTGQLLAVLENKELRFRFMTLLLRRDKLALKERLARSRGKLNEVQIIREQMLVLEKELDERKKDIAALNVLAPGTGTVAGSGLDSLLGRFIFRGREIIRIVSRDQKYLVASCSQNDIDRVRVLVGKGVTTDMRNSGSGIFTAVLEKISPVAATDLIHPALGAVFGGPLNVRRRVVREEAGSQYYRYELFGPRFQLEIALPEDLKDRLRVGQTATVRVRGNKVILWRRIVSRFESWLQSKR